MPKVLITGSHGYIANNIKEYLEKNNSECVVEQFDLRNKNWEKADFADVDVVIHTAGIVHNPQLDDWNEYKKVNIELTLKLAEKAKIEGVRHFIFFSSMAVYGKGKELSEKNIITRDTLVAPTSLYGKSKAIAEQELLRLSSDNFIVSIVRPPNVYGKGCKGNYITRFTTITKMLPMIPAAYQNVKQSMIYIENLCELIRLEIENPKAEILTPQDISPISACELMSAIARNIGKSGRTSSILGLGIYMLSFLPVVKKAYGGVAYAEEDSKHFDNKYVIVGFDEAIRRTTEEA